MKKMLLIIALSVATALTTMMFYEGFKFSQLDDDAKFKTYLQDFFNDEFDYEKIDGDAEKLREIISKTHIELHGEIENVKLHKLRDRMFDLIWTHHIGGFSNYMKLRKPKGIEYNFYTNSLYYNESITRLPHLAGETNFVEWAVFNAFHSAHLGNVGSNLISEVCVDYEELQKGRHLLWNIFRNITNTNALFGVHVFRTNSLTDPRFCEDVLDHQPEKWCFPFTSTNMTSRFNLITNAICMVSFSTPIPLYTTPETPRQELETTGEITLAYAYFAFKCIHHKNAGAPFIAQWHWDKNLNRWITDYFCSGIDYRNPPDRYGTEPFISTIF